MSVWVEIKIVATLQLFKQSRSTWACELKFTISLNFVSSALSRSTWACELKCIICTVCSCHWSHAPRERVSWNYRWSITLLKIIRHAPRERVSWNILGICQPQIEYVTLHVSVWVEIAVIHLPTAVCTVTLHVSVWVEMTDTGLAFVSPSHAPRERVSWNDLFATTF